MCQRIMSATLLLFSKLNGAPSFACWCRQVCGYLQDSTTQFSQADYLLQMAPVWTVIYNCSIYVVLTAGLYVTHFSSIKYQYLMHI